RKARNELAREKLKAKAVLEAKEAERESEARWAEKSKELISEDLKRMRATLHDVNGKLNVAELKAREMADDHARGLARLTDEIKRLERLLNVALEENERIRAEHRATIEELRQVRAEYSALLQQARVNADRLDTLERKDPA